MSPQYLHCLMIGELTNANNEKESGELKKLLAVDKKAMAQWNKLQKRFGSVEVARIVKTLDENLSPEEMLKIAKNNVILDTEWIYD